MSTSAVEHTDDRRRAATRSTSSRPGTIFVLVLFVADDHPAVGVGLRDPAQPGGHGMSADALERAAGARRRARSSMGIDPYEKNWMRVSIAAARGVRRRDHGRRLRGRLPAARRPTTRSTLAPSPTEGPWADPGLREIGDGEYEAYVVAQAWSFAPRELVVPVGAEVDDLRRVAPTSSTASRSPTPTSTCRSCPARSRSSTYTFDEIGEFPYICTEYCGQGHAAMYGTVKVVSRGRLRRSVEHGSTDAPTPAPTARRDDGGDRDDHHRPSTEVAVEQPGYELTPVRAALHRLAPVRRDRRARRSAACSGRCRRSSSRASNLYQYLDPIFKSYYQGLTLHGVLNALGVDDVLHRRVHEPHDDQGPRPAAQPPARSTRSASA